jgi:hypothetical protein
VNDPAPWRCYWCDDLEAECTCTPRESDPWSVTYWRPSPDVCRVRTKPLPRFPCPEHQGPNCRCGRCYGCRRVIAHCICVFTKDGRGPSGKFAGTQTAGVRVSIQPSELTRGRLAVHVELQPDANQKQYRAAYSLAKEWNRRLLAAQGPNVRTLRDKLVRAHARGASPDTLRQQVAERLRQMLVAVARGQMTLGRLVEASASELGLDSEDESSGEWDAFLSAANRMLAEIRQGNLNPDTTGLIELEAFRTRLYTWGDTASGRALRALAAEIPDP